MSTCRFANDAFIVDVSLSVTILRKETLIMRTDSPASRDRLLADFRDCIEAASSRECYFCVVRVFLDKSHLL